MRTVRAKFLCTLVKYNGYGGKDVTLHAVYGTDDADNSENNQFSQATPSGTVTMTIDNPDAKGFFKEGTSYYLDFQKSPDQYDDVYGTAAEKLKD